MNFALCSNNHPVNYKGCSTYKDLQSRKKPNSKYHNQSNLNFKTNIVKDSHLSGNTPLNINANQFQTYIQAIQNQPPPQNTPLSTPDTNTQMSSFFNEFKLLINPLISLITKVISSLLDKK
ncbi:Hypothetical protein CINCED_3A018410 [Cinara cedri]|uniref:Uncharacterized protein n=1 Tax=Cinara cedri TaxID=506608 RepID=A0A5E4M5E4_9HEMI|nr:Hypothetical protein CINCED_3A018410 [Cinara cedri]